MKTGKQNNIDNKERLKSRFVGFSKIVPLNYSVFYHLIFLSKLECYDKIYPENNSPYVIKQKQHYETLRWQL